MDPIKFGRIAEPWWSDKPVAIVGAGKSLIGFDLEQLRGGWCHVLAVKGVIFDLPWADAGTGIDAPRYMEWADRFTDVTMPVYWAHSGHHDLKPQPNVVFLHRIEGQGLSEECDRLHGGGTSGFAAVNVAYLKRAKQIALFGFDYLEVGQRINSQHYTRPRPQSGALGKQWARRFEEMLAQLKKAGVEIINGSADSAITAFPKYSPDEALATTRSWHFRNIREMAAG